MLDDIINNPDRGIVSLVGENGNLSELTGLPEPSKLVPGSLVVETEHGLLYLPKDEKVRISEWYPETLGQHTLRDQPHWRLSWEIDDTDHVTPHEAATSAWRNIFGRDEAGAGDACVFRVTDVATGEDVTVDLSKGRSLDG
jgi:hypothetical protein